MPATMDGLADGEPAGDHPRGLPRGRRSRWPPGRVPRSSDVRTVASHPHALAQTAGWLAAQRRRRRCRRPRPRRGRAAVAAGEFDAAVCAPIAAERYGLDAAGRRHRRPPRRGDPLRAGRPPGRAARADGQRQDLARRRRRRPHRRAAVAAVGVRRPRHLADPHRVAAHPRAARRLLLLPRLRGARRRPRGWARRWPRCTGSATTSGSSAPTRAPTAGRTSRCRPTPTTPRSPRPRRGWAGCGRFAVLSPPSRWPSAETTSARRPHSAACDRLRPARARARVGSAAGRRDSRLGHQTLSPMQRDGRRHHQRADDEGVEQDAEADQERQLREEQQRQHRQRAERRGQHHAGAGDHPAGDRERAQDAVAGCRAAPTPPAPGSSGRCCSRSRARPGTRTRSAGCRGRCRGSRRRSSNSSAATPDGGAAR